MSASDQQAIREVIRTWMEATAAGDVDRVLSSSSRAITPTSGAACVSPQRPRVGSRCVVAVQCCLCSGKSRTAAGCSRATPTC
jgi:hypothetical protein